jgi:hypothetical protein
MYQLSEKAIDALKKDKNVRRKVASVMGVGDEAIRIAIARYNGASIAKHYDGLNMLSDITGIQIKDLRVLCA